MRGLAKGEVCSTSNPVLQLFCRSGEFLIDLYAGEFKIEDISDPTAAPTVVVAATPFDATHKLGTGRYVIPTGATGTWNHGTHRAICTYSMELGGKTYTQVISFEILDAVEYPSGASFISYASSRDLLKIAALAALNPEDLQPQIHHFSQLIEKWTRRFFEPRYLKIKLSGPRKIALWLNEAVIAVEDVYSWAKYATGEDYYSTFDHGCYAVFNRHLDGLLAPDDRRDPKLELVSDVLLKDTYEPVRTFQWPYGHQNIEIRGVFGYTDPEVDDSQGKIYIGRTPKVLTQILTALVCRQVLDPTLSDPSIAFPGSIKSARTVDQSISFGGAGAAGALDSGMSGDPIIDRMLLPLYAPIRIEWTELRD